MMNAASSQQRAASSGNSLLLKGLLLAACCLLLTPAFPQKPTPAPAQTKSILLKGGTVHEERIVLADAPVERAVSLSLVATPEATAPADDKLRALQEKFRKLKDKR